MGGTAAALEVFISYSHEDNDLRADLENHLALLQRQGLVSTWHDRYISAGTEWAGQIDSHLESARIILLLVSSDFIASEYCYDKEMTRALERHRLGAARVIPVILRPVDWHSAPFGTLECLPEDGKAVTLWSNRDEAFLDIAEGLREAVASLSGVTAGRLNAGEGRAHGRRYQWLVTLATIGILVLVAAGAVPWVMAQRRHVREGDGYLNVARYDAAKVAFRHALSLNRWSAAASWGLEIASTPDLQDPVVFEQKVRELYARGRRDPYVHVFMGDLAARERDTGTAMQFYEEALKAEPDLAEAYFKLGVLNDQAGQEVKAEQFYQQAVDRSKTTPRYRNNLAYLFSKKGRDWYDKALAQYGRNDRYPLSAVEAAFVLWYQGNFAEARDLLQQAATWLGDSRIMDLSENRGPWYFEIGNAEAVEVDSEADKQCLTDLSLSATLFVLGNEGAANQHREKALASCGSHFTDIQSVVRFELDRLAREQPGVVSRVQAFARTVPDGRR